MVLKHELNKGNNKRHIKVDGGKTRGPQSYTKYYTKLINAEWKEESIPKKITPICYPI